MLELLKLLICGKWKYYITYEYRSGSFEYTSHTHFIAKDIEEAYSNCLFLAQGKKEGVTYVNIIYVYRERILPSKS